MSVSSGGKIVAAFHCLMGRLLILLNDNGMTVCQGLNISPSHNLIQEAMRLRGCLTMNYFLIGIQASSALWAPSSGKTV